MKESRSETVHLSKRRDLNLFIPGRSKTGLKELSIIFACDKDKSVVRIGKRIDVDTEPYAPTTPLFIFFVVTSFSFSFPILNFHSYFYLSFLFCYQRSWPPVVFYFSLILSDL